VIVPATNAAAVNNPNVAVGINSLIANTLNPIVNATVAIINGRPICFWANRTA
jgi:hypothetical protein